MKAGVENSKRHIVELLFIQAVRGTIDYSLPQRRGNSNSVVGRVSLICLVVFVHKHGSFLILHGILCRSLSAVPLLLISGTAILSIFI